MKDGKYPLDEDERSRKRLRRLRVEEEKFIETEIVKKKRMQKDKIIDEETQKEEKKRIKKDKILNEEEDEEKEEEDEYADYSKKET